MFRHRLYVINKKKRFLLDDLWCFKEMDSPAICVMSSSFESVYIHEIDRIDEETTFINIEIINVVTCFNDYVFVVS